MDNTTDRSLINAGFLVIIIGVILIFLGGLFTAWQGTSTSTATNTSRGNITSVGVGGCVIIGPIPICFGSGTAGIYPMLLVLSIILTVLTVVLFLILPLYLHRKLQQDMI